MLVLCKTPTCLKFDVYFIYLSLHRFSIGNCELEFQSKSPQRSPEEEISIDNETALSSNSPFSGQIAGLLFSECLFSNGQENSTPQLTKVSHALISRFLAKSFA
ncbi:unnamed protein product [Hymenolepis diminuta]|uniref:Ovule protein n=1 Tax=Hymenolepis diminuta TaxID=6216 RepID=A0A0R3SDM3_HYMDI|nr:unnamed protein product [Hymenolepis diminuta]